jgi:hypothetical protein
MALVVVLLGGAARADRAPAPVVAERLARADAVVVGTVTAVEDREVTARWAFGGDQKVTYRVAVVKIDEALLGAKGQTHLRVAALPNGKRDPHLTVKVGDQGLFVLTRHPDEAFHVVPAYYDLVPKARNANFAPDLAEARRCVKVLTGGLTQGLKSKDADERLLAAALVVHGARCQPYFFGKGTRTEPLDAELSRLTLEALTSADWGKQDPFALTPLALFTRLGLTAKDGWQPPPNLAEVPAAAKRWLRDNAGSYRIQKLVAEK